MWLGIALFSRPHLLLRWKRPSLRPDGTKRSGYHWAVAAQSANRAAVQSGGAVIRKMRPFKEPHAFVSHKAGRLALKLGLCDSIVN